MVGGTVRETKTCYFKNRTDEKNKFKIAIKAKGILSIKHQSFYDKMPFFPSFTLLPYLSFNISFIRYIIVSFAVIANARGNISISAEYML